MNQQAELDAATGLPIGSQVDGSAAGWPDTKLLRGRTVRLEALNSAQHGDALWDEVGGAKHADLWLYMSEGPFAERKEFDAALRHSAQADDRVFFAIVNQATGQAAGWCALLNIKPQHRSVEVGHLLFSPGLQRTAAATETLYLLARYAFDELGYRRYEWKCNALNAKSRRAAERFGFVFEGIFRQHMIIKGRNRDTAWFSMTAEEWPRVKQALENWLRPENFDENGKQRQKLASAFPSNSVK